MQMRIACTSVVGPLLLKRKPLNYPPQEEESARPELPMKVAHNGAWERRFLEDVIDHRTMSPHFSDDEDSILILIHA
ncbi:hypothetical protein HNY73_019654 [Argiope bruennichi]|uniref:Uncharacterized protein n=1 Tax=Argiope bruennichi TaxID=94029 RepID=A0A8T0E5D3_ARGBR|nr:hypothetical protein HNY73_019654 [Argiope bruennichi]